MKKKTIIISSIIILAILANIWILTRPKSLGNINYSAAKPATNNSNILFPGKTGEKIKFSFASNIKSGNLDITLSDSTGNIVYELDKARKLTAYYTLESTDTYKLSANYSGFTGYFKIKFYSAK